MKFKVKDYRANKQMLIAGLRRCPGKDPIEVAGEVAVYTYCPLIAMYTFLGEIQGMTPELEKRISDLVKFYGITEVINEN